LGKQSRIRRLYPKRLARRLAGGGRARAELEAFAEREAEETIRRMQARGWRLVTRLDTGEGVFVRDDEMVGLHIQLPTELYRKLDAECRRRETTKRQLVIAALESYLS
jgi:hypothetical protein